MKLVVEPAGSLSGKVELFPSKLCTQVACAAGIMTGRKCTIKHPLNVRDTQAMLKALESLGAEVKRAKDRWMLTAPDVIKPATGAIDSKNSGSTLAILAGVLSVSKSPVVLTGDQKLRSRPMPALLRGLRRMGADINSTKPDDTPPFIIFGGGLAGGEVKVGEKDLRFLPAFVTSAPHAKEKVVFNMPARADVFMDPVEEVLSAAGIKLVRKGKKLLVANQRYRTFTYEVRREVAGVAPLMVAQLLAGEEVKIRIEEVYPRDEVFLKILEDLGVRRSKSGKRLRLWTQKLRGAQVDLSLTPELLPFVATVACMAKGRTIIRNASEARDMKSDRINAMATELKKIGAKVLEQGDGMLVQGPVQFRGGEVDGHADYAVTASLAVASLFAKERVLIKNGPEALRTAYPQFLSSFREIGAQVSHQS